MKGKFIVLEGIDNCGKTTQAKMLEKYFQEQGTEVVLAREPGGTQIGEEIREVVLKPRDAMANPITQTLLFYAARTEFMDQLVKPNIDAGKMVITDRFESSTYVYQGIVQGVDLSLLDTLSEYCVKNSGAYPELFIIIDIPVEESLKRAGNADRKGQDLIYEMQGVEFLEKLRQGYLTFAKAHPDTVKVIDGMQSKEDLFKAIKALLS
jgi:dTMP kinase